MEGGGRWEGQNFQQLKKVQRLEEEEEQEEEEEEDCLYRCMWNVPYHNCIIHNRLPEDEPSASKHVEDKKNNN